VLNDGFHVDIRIVSKKEFPHALQHFTGSKEHNVKLRARAKELGYTMSEYGLRKDEDVIYMSNEKEIYDVLGYSYIEPELREDTGELETAERDELPELIENGHIRGVFHVHTNWSDGKCDLTDIEKKAIEKGLEYVGISDHSSGAFYANGLSEDRLREQIRTVREFDRRSDIRFLIGTECNIKKDGSLDYSDEILSELDFVIISVHDNLRMTGAEQTERILRALDNPYVTMLGHPTGRLLLRRDAMVFDMDRILKKCAINDIIVEINSNPMRLDLDWKYIKKAKELGVKFSINPDSHRVEAFDYIDYGINTARKGWLEKADVINTYSLKEIQSRFF
jgi:DNA polymerase (family 10)